MKVRVTKEMTGIDSGRFYVHADNVCVAIRIFTTDCPSDSIYNEQVNQNAAMEVAKKYEAIDKLPDLITIYETAE